MSHRLEGLVRQSTILGKSLTRERVNQYLQAGNPAQDFLNALDIQEKAHLSRIRTLLQEPELDQAVGDEELTFAMIRPQLQQGKKRGTDQELYREISYRIDRNFRQVLNLSWPVSPEAFTSFYQHVKDSLSLRGQKTLDGRLSTVWDVFLECGIKGSSTFLVLGSRGSGKPDRLPAWQLWRTFIGATDPNKALPGTLRGDYGSDYNNIVHGSDSLSSVRSDIRWMVSQLGDGS